MVQITPLYKGPKTNFLQMQPKNTLPTFTKIYMTIFEENNFAKLKSLVNFFFEPPRKWNSKKLKKSFFSAVHVCEITMKWKPISTSSEVRCEIWKMWKTWNTLQRERFIWRQTCLIREYRKRGQLRTEWGNIGHFSIIHVSSSVHQFGIKIRIHQPENQLYKILSQTALQT